MPIGTPTTRDGILALYEEVKPEFRAFLADKAAKRDVKKMAVSRQSFLKGPTTREALRTKIEALSDAFGAYQGADKEDIESKPVHGANFGGEFFRFARGVTKHIPVVGGVVRSVDGSISDRLGEVLNSYTREVLDNYIPISERGIRALPVPEHQIVSEVGAASPKMSSDEAVKKIQAAFKERREAFDTYDPFKPVEVEFNGENPMRKKGYVAKTRARGDAPAALAGYRAPGLGKLLPGRSTNNKKGSLPQTPESTADTALESEVKKIQAAYRGYSARKNFKPEAMRDGAKDPVAVQKTKQKAKQYDEIKSLRAQFNTDAKNNNRGLLRPTVDLLIKADPANTSKFIQGCMDKGLGGPDFNKHLTEELGYAKTKISAMQDRAKMNARAAKQEIKR